jgi:quinol monooxygenase YgiN
MYCSRKIHQGGDMMLTVVARLPIKEGKMDDALKMLKELIAKIALEEGTAFYSLNKDKSNPNMLVVVEQYMDKAAFDYHSSTPYFKAFFAASGAFIGGKPEITVMEEITRI